MVCCYLSGFMNDCLLADLDLDKEFNFLFFPEFEEKVTVSNLCYEQKSPGITPVKDHLEAYESHMFFLKKDDAKRMFSISLATKGKNFGRYNLYIWKVELWKRVHPDLVISLIAMGIINNFVNAEKEVEFTIRLILLGELVKCAVSEGKKVVRKYTDSQEDAAEP
ncbi:hypothetical protein IFM89_005140 [Coptis chinensis]|uniref:Uncharacterized protein n=1 Tax=Coptis chinensis TaxID=261450 RepID=A0A835IJM9_9MAGN|nr:hypothetical protein IFM89_005140 [Coptis chinensis]